jgi:hypothetical protein
MQYSRRQSRRFASFFAVIFLKQSNRCNTSGSLALYVMKLNFSALCVSGELGSRFPFRQSFNNTRFEEVAEQDRPIATVNAVVLGYIVC